ncbi:glycosyl transferase [Acanthamoeba castellanii str. Neff]|uniref:Fucosyltransferase n=1 Tax=Acanthamoeba castellanii (strain ATCC 30010 / Neff) TaxID=1257118 RepID=L8GX84_ACACF|nr:glycosyl transferase [Acanthamoeba castellanii str. Neff]ELR17173.1 glycosyl transferase [Acanthamoeba castellanii str. Neff]
MKYGGATMRPRLGVSGRSKRGTFIKWSILLSVLGLLSFYLYVMFATFRGGDAGSTHPVADAREPQVIDPKKQQLDEAHRTDPILQRKRKIILSTGHGKWNTGVWPAWGYGQTVTLNWAAAGVEVNKKCSIECEISHEGSAGYADADAVVMELTNHPKFGYDRDMPIAWPEESRPNPRHWYTAKVDGHKVPTNLPLTGIFYYEAVQSYPGYTAKDPAIKSRIDFSMTPDLDSTMPVTLICPWGHTVSEYLRPPPLKPSERFIAYFNEHGIAPPFLKIVEELFAAAGDRMHSYGPFRSNRDMPDEAGGNPYQLSRRISFMGTYKFVLVTEALVEDSFIAPEWSHAILGGAVPVYIGTPNIGNFAPGPRSFVDIRDFASGAELWEFLLRFDNNDEAYQQWFDWKAGAKKAYKADEKSQHAVGTGEGVHVDDIEAEVLRRRMVRWSKPVVERLHDLDAEAAAAFHDTASMAWRWFRAHIDNCVHYAECRLCELVTKLT